MTDRAFKIGDMISQGWELTKNNLPFLIGYQIILYVLTLFTSKYGYNSTLVNLIAWILVVIVKMGLYKSCLLITDGIKPHFDQLYLNWRMFLTWIIANLLFGLMFAIGLILFIVPGLYVWARYGLFPFFIVDKGVGPIEALKLSSKATEGVRWEIFLLFLACTGLNILGFLIFGVGLLFTIPISLLAITKVYRMLTNNLPATGTVL